MPYVDGFVTPVKKDARDAYETSARRFATIMKDYGALRIVECWADDVPDGVVTSFRLAVKLEPDEVVVFSWIEWPSREVRDVGMKASWEDPRMEKDPANFPFDGKRMIYGGFASILDT